MMNLGEQIKNIDLVELAESAGIDLRRRGTAHIGKCPLHDEDNPSFYIYPSNRFKCFGCNAGGDAADFIQQLYQCDFAEALRRLGISGQVTLKEKIEIKQRQRLKAERIQRERELLHTLGMLIRTTQKCMVSMTREQFDRYGEIMDGLPAWEHCHDVLSTGTREQRDEVISGLQDMTTISRKYLFRPDFNYRKWLFNINHKSTKGANTNFKGAGTNGKKRIRRS